MTSEPFKAGVHFAIFSLASMAGGYNLMTYGEERDPRHLVNALVYGVLLAFEASHISRHLKAR